MNKKTAKKLKRQVKRARRDIRELYAEVARLDTLPATVHIGNVSPLTEAQ